MVRVRELVARRSPSPLAGKGRGGGSEPSVRLVEFDPDAERKVVAAALFPHSDQPLEEGAGDPAAVLDALLEGRDNRRQRAPRALEHATYTFEIVANFAAYRHLHRHRMLTQDRQLLDTDLGYDLPRGLVELDMAGDFSRAVEGAAEAHRRLERDLGRALAQYIVPLAFHVRWSSRVNLRELYHL